MTFVWADEQQKAFDSLKDALIHAPLLMCPDFTRPLSRETDVGVQGLGTKLPQKTHLALAELSSMLVDLYLQMKDLWKIGSVN